jgi:hypothetical protein
MRVVAVTVPAKLTEPPEHYPLELLYDLAFLNGMGDVIRLLDNGFWRYSESAVLELIEQTPPDMLLLYGNVSAYENMWSLKKKAFKRTPNARIYMTRTESWSNVRKERRPAPFYKHLTRVPDRMPYPQFGWLDLDAYQALKHPQYGEKPETWKKWFEVPVTWIGRRFNPKYFVDQLRYFRERWAIDGFRFLGYPFSDIPWSVEFRKLMRLSDACLNFSWMCDLDIHAVDAARIIWAKDNSCVAFRVPLENSQCFLTDYDALDACVSACQAVTVPVYVDFKVGWVTDTVEAYLAAVEFCRTHEIECRPEIVSADDVFCHCTKTEIHEFNETFWNNPSERPPVNLTRWPLGHFLGLVELLRREDERGLQDLLQTPQSPDLSHISMPA